MPLTLQRQAGEAIVISTDPPVRVIVQRVDRGRVRLTIDVPDNIPVWREELHQDGMPSLAKWQPSHPKDE